MDLLLLLISNTLKINSKRRKKNISQINDHNNKWASYLTNIEILRNNDNVKANVDIVDGGVVYECIDCLMTFETLDLTQKSGFIL